MVHRCKKCSEISEVTSGGGGEIEYVKNDMPPGFQFHLRQQMLLLKSHCTFYIYGALGKKVFCRILKRWFISRITGQNVQKSQILLFFASYIATILNCSRTFGKHYYLSITCHEPKQEVLKNISIIGDRYL